MRRQLFSMRQRDMRFELNFLPQGKALATKSKTYASYVSVISVRFYAAGLCVFGAENTDHLRIQ